MLEFPFTQDEWHEVSQHTLAVLNATLMDDEVLRSSKFVELQELLGAMRAKYGAHPVLLETEADFCDDPDQSLELYQAALAIARREGLPTDSIQDELSRLRSKSRESGDLP